MNHIFCDLDGTLSDDRGRLILIDPEDKSFRAYHEKLEFDRLLWDNLQHVYAMRSLNRPCKLILFTSRPNTYRQQTERWLAKQRVNYSRLLMRPAGILLDSPEMKIQLAEIYLKETLEEAGSKIVGVFDNEYSVIRAFALRGVRGLWVHNSVRKKERWVQNVMPKDVLKGETPGSDRP